MVCRTNLILLAAFLLGLGLVWAQSAAVPGPGSEQAAEVAESEGAVVMLPDTSVEPAAEAAEPPLSPMRRADILMARKRYREAIEVYQEALRETAVTYNKMGIAYHQLEDFRAALQNYNKALEFDPNYAEAINNIGAVHHARRDYGRAIRQYEKAIELNPTSASLYTNLGMAYLARKQSERAFTAFAEALRLNPDIFNQVGGTGGSLLQQRNIEEWAEYHYLMAKAYAKQGMAREALLYIRKAMEEGFRHKDRFRKEPEFASLQDLQEFQDLMELEPRVL